MENVEFQCKETDCHTQCAHWVRNDSVFLRLLVVLHIIIFVRYPLSLASSAAPPRGQPSNDSFVQYDEWEQVTLLCHCETSAHTGRGNPYPLPQYEFAEMQWKT